MTNYSAGDRIYSSRHTSGEILVDIAGSKVLLGRVIRKDGTPGREVIVPREAVVAQRLLLPGCDKGGAA
ncbi:hypothetical protein dsx2_2520 [Desulfovibrio sp. X2]|uniref:hypothetical protein n=1 Tax=Desulfovibrio sp. X2 TaxID=941449 RepID=UPI000358BCC1|nr:hypothetical protein [Desulfovibrio sp. X2]EPR43160.1 hypothetical protein dsx2_2520 [Desulfovibrio sp. X2]